MRAEYQAHIDELMQQYRQVRDNLGRMQREMAELTATAQSEDELVKVTVDHRGALTAVDINPRAFRALDSATLGETIVATAKAATDDLRRRVQELVTPNMPDVAGLSRMGGDFDFSKMFPEDPKDMPGLRDLRPGPGAPPPRTG
ncbi:YbaB/EbfC family nucleoid-associated protein [Dactylosporangium sp. CS-047395]|uniref:YbaB/EbfC family nucleoid-associated protein n=1 Tax=Dactylosporangium sp. CS-047395 TaxID=3239936 RepID=UPI003D8B7742